MGTDQSRRNLFFIAAGTLLTSMFTRSKLSSLDQSDVDTLLVKSELSLQIDRLLDTVIKKNPQHLNLTEQQMATLKAEGTAELHDLFKTLAEQNFTQADLTEMVRHLSQPAERKWQQFNRLAIDEAKTLLTGKIEGVLQNKKTV